MKPGLSTAHSLPAEPLAPAGRQVQFPERASVSRLRTLRAQLFKQGRLTEALQVARHLVDVNPGRESYCHLGVVLRESGAFTKALRVLRDALRFKDGPAYLVSEIHLHTAYTWYCLHDYKRMGEALDRAHAQRLKPRTDWKLHTTLGSYLLSQGDYRRALEEFTRAEATAPTVQARGRALTNQAIIHYKLHDLNAAEASIDRALILHKRARQAGDLAHSRMLRAAFWQDRGQHARALGMGFRAALTFERLGNLDGAKRTYGTAGYAAAFLGSWERSRGLFEKVLSLTRQSTDPRSLVFTLSWLALANAKLEDFEVATQFLAEAKQAMRGLRDYVGAMSLYRAQAGIAEIFGDWKQVRLWSRKAERYSHKQGDAVRVAEFRAQRARAEAALGRRRAALHATKTALAVACNIGRAQTLHAAVLRKAQRLAASGVPLLLTGESGVGKTELAGLIHRSGPRAKRPLVVAPCELLTFPASDLNGYVEGAWSGARGTSKGYGGQAEDGTLVLDRVDELSAEAQRVLVPVVEGRVRAVGSAEERKAGYRVVATCRNPERLIPELRRRLSGAVLGVPPLRERVEEIPALVRSKLGASRITEDALALLAAQPWPGNLPELEAVLARLRSTPVIGVKAVRKALPGKPNRRSRRVAELAAMAAALHA